MSFIHPTAGIDPKAEIEADVVIGPYSIVGPHVRLCEGVELRGHSHVTGHTEIGAGCVIYPFASVGETPQDRKYKGEPTRLSIGARNVIREYATLHPGTSDGGGVTTIGDDNMIMIGVHIGHDCHIGKNVLMTNGTQLAGHVRIEDFAVLGASVHSHQNCRVGESAMLGALSAINMDVAPFTIVTGAPARILKVNRINMERRGFSNEQMEAVERAFRIIFRSGVNPAQAFSQVREELPDSREAEYMVAFLEKSERGFCRMR